MGLLITAPPLVDAGKQGISLSTLPPVPFDLGDIPHGKVRFSVPDDFAALPADLPSWEQGPGREESSEAALAATMGIDSPGVIARLGARLSPPQSPGLCSADSPLPRLRT